MCDLKTNLSSLLGAIALEKFCNKGDVLELVSWFIESGILEERNIVRYLVKHQYLQRIQEKGHIKQHVKLDLADEFKISLETVNNIIYRYHHIKP